ELAGDGVHAEDLRPGERAEQRHVEAELEEVDELADVAAEPVSGDRPAEAGVRPPPAAEEPAAAQPARDPRGGGDVGEDEPGDERARPVPRDQDHDVDGEEHELLDGDGEARAVRVVGALEEALPDGHESLRERRDGRGERHPDAERLEEHEEEDRAQREPDQCRQDRPDHGQPRERRPYRALVAVAGEEAGSRPGRMRTSVNAPTSSGPPTRATRTVATPSDASAPTRAAMFPATSDTSRVRTDFVPSPPFPPDGPVSGDGMPGDGASGGGASAGPVPGGGASGGEVRGGEVSDGAASGRAVPEGAVIA